MDIINIKIDELNIIKENDIDITIGAYDGINNGHIAVLNELIKKKGNHKTAVMTFKSHPDLYLHKRSDQGSIETIDEKVLVLETLGIDYLLVLDNEFLSLSYQEFNQVLKKLKVKRVVVGNDFVYGKGALGNIDTLKGDFTIDVIDIIKDENGKLSSSTIREALKNGDISLVNKYLNKEYQIKGVVSNNDKDWNLPGYKIATLEIGEKYHDLKKGIYHVVVDINENENIKSYNGLAYFNKSKEPWLEIYILNYDNNLYGKEIVVRFISFIRDEIDYNTKEELLKQIKEDIKR